MRAQLTGFSFPELDAVKRGEGTIRLQLAATLPRLSAGVASAAVPQPAPVRIAASIWRTRWCRRAPDVTVTAQRRDPDQTELTIDYLLRAAPPPLAPAWLLGGLAVTVLLSGLLIRPLRSLR